MDFTEKTVNEISKACFEMGRVKTGALIVIARADSLTDYTRTGIDVDALVTSQLLINIFEHNTPLHDGAVIIKGNRIVSATCYLPLSDNMALSKALGTRHRAGVGISETTDSITVIVSEETGRVSVAMKGKLYGNVNPDDLKEKLQAAIVKPQKDEKKFFWKKPRRDNEG
jgi:diadenylate cyclase